MRSVLAGGVIALLLAMAPVAAAPVAVPAALEPWRDWALQDHQTIACPLLVGQDAAAAQAHVCAWPGLLQVQATDEGAQFSLEWQIEAVEQDVPLPGDSRQRPLAVTVDGVDATVLFAGTRPSLRLAPGIHRIEGRFSWSRRPEQLAIPAEIGLLQLSVDGSVVAVPERDREHLWLGRSAAQSVAADALSVRAFRLLTDGVPPMLSTVLQLEVSGRAREQALGQVLPEGFVAVSLQSPLPAAIGADGGLTLQLRPGSWRIQLDARSLQVAEQYSPPAIAAPWPEEEIWSFRAAPELRSVQPWGERPVDPQQVGVPWNESLPTFVLTPEQALRLDQRSRGLDPRRPHRLHLQRDVWLDFSGGGLTARDHVHGTLAGPGRLEMAAPWELLQAEADGQSLLITAGEGARTVGVEVRDRALDLSALSRRADLAGGLTSGWSSDLESMSMQLHLPPGWQLLGAGGADSAPSAWIEQWSLLDLFLLALTTLLAYRVFGVGFALLVLGYLLLGYQETGSPLWTLIGAMLAGLLLRWLPPGWVAGTVNALRGLLLLAALLWALPFAAGQLKLALYPQLECHEVDHGGGGFGCYDNRSGAGLELAEVTYLEPPPPPPSPKEAPMRKALPMTSDAASDPTPMSIAAPPPAPPVTYAPPLEAYPKDAILQAGPGQPDWRWRQADIGWDGPVQRQQSLQLWLSPPWLTRLLRVSIVLLLGGVLLRLARKPQRPAEAAAEGARPSAAGALSLTVALALLVLTAAFARPAVAADFPPEELLEQLRERLLRAPPCSPNCASYANASVQIDGDRLRLALDLHAGSDSAVPLPDPGKTAVPLSAQLDGRAATLRRQGASDWLRLPRGVHRAELQWRLAPTDAISLRFPLPPAQVQLNAVGWQAAGLHDGRLLGDTLQLLRSAPVAKGAASTPTALEFPPFVRVTRQLQLDLDWSVLTRVERVAPAQSGFSVTLPLIEGEQVLDDDLAVEDGQITLSLAAGQRSLAWRSQLPISPLLRLSAGPLTASSEFWQVTVGPFWHAEHTGVPEIDLDQRGGSLSFQPLPGEALQLNIQRPAAVAGDSVAIDRADLHWQPGERVSAGQLELDLRSTRGGQHVLTLPLAAELVSVELRGEIMPLRLVEGRLALPLIPGSQQLRLHWREAHGLHAFTETPPVDLGAPTANVQVTLQIPERRWLLAVRGGGVGPALLVWPQLLLMLALAFVLARWSGTPLRFHHWLLLGLGFSTVSWVAAVIVTGWLLLLRWRQRAADRVVALPRWRFAVLQLGLLAATLVALVCLLGAVPYGLLGQPDMQLTGNGSGGGELHWFFDRVDALVPQVAALSMPLWWYKAAILAWSLWLANALIGWLRWAWQSLSAGGYWPPGKTAALASESQPPAPVDGEVPRPEAPSPDPASPEAANPETANPETANPETANPEAASSEAASPEAASPEAASPEAASPEAARPESPDMPPDDR